MRRSAGAGQAPTGNGWPLPSPAPVPNPRCLVRKNATFGTDLLPCEGLAALLARREGVRIGVFVDLRLGTTSTLLAIMPETGEPVAAEACPACGTRLARDA